MYYIYHIPGIKIGVSMDPTKRVNDQGYSNFDIIEEHSDIIQVSNREIELQKEYNYKVDTILYFKTIEHRNLGVVKGGIISGNKNAQTPGKMKSIGALGGVIGGKINMAKEHTCPHCAIKMKGPNAFRYHFDNCKTLKLK